MVSVIDIAHSSSIVALPNEILCHIASYTGTRSCLCLSRDVNCRHFTPHDRATWLLASYLSHEDEPWVVLPPPRDPRRLSRRFASALAQTRRAHPMLQRRADGSTTEARALCLVQRALMAPEGRRTLAELVRLADVPGRARFVRDAALPDRQDRLEAWLVQAASRGWHALCDYYLKEAAPGSFVGARDSVALMRAAAGGHAEVCRLLITRGGQRADAGESLALLRAARAGHLDACRVLLTSHIDPARTWHRDGAAMRAALENDDDEMLELMQGHHADSAARSLRSSHVFAGTGHGEIVRGQQHDAVRPRVEQR